MLTKDYIAVIQCHIVMERCSGYFCEKAFHERSGLFSDYPDGRSLRMISMTCGGCCGLAVHRKLLDLIRYSEKKEGIQRDRIMVHLSTCITHDNYHGPVCPNLDYIETIIREKLQLDFRRGTRISDLSEKRRESGIYQL